MELGKNERRMRGQITFPVFLGFIVTIILYFSFLPIMEQFITLGTGGLDPASPNYAINVALAYLLPFLVLLAIIIGLFHYTIPQQESVGRYY